MRIWIKEQPKHKAAFKAFLTYWEEDPEFVFCELLKIGQGVAFYAVHKRWPKRYVRGGADGENDEEDAEEGEEEDDGGGNGAEGDSDDSDDD